MRAIFLSDTHLRRDTMENYRYLLQFFTALKNEIEWSRGGNRADRCVPSAGNSTKPIDRLYLMGDFFDFWFAKGTRYYPGFDRIITVLREMKDLGVQVHLFEGNHDFFLGDFFTDHLGIPVYTDEASIDLDGRRFYVAHGDLVDQSNRGYLMLRKFLRSRFIRMLHRILPSRLVWRIALISSETSKAMWAETGKRLTDKMCRFALDIGARGYDGVILGHSHQPLLWSFSVAGEKKVLVTLGDWLLYRSYLDYQDGRFSLNYYNHDRLNGRTGSDKFVFGYGNESEKI